MIEIDPSENRIFRIVQTVIQIIRKWNAAGEVTLRAGQVSTPVDRLVSRGAENVSLDDKILLTATTPNAAAAMTNVFVSSVGQGGFVLGHASAVSIDRTFYWAAR